MYKDLETFMNDAESVFKEVIECALDELHALKIQCALYAKYKIGKHGFEKIDFKHFTTKNSKISQVNNIDEIFDEIRSIIAISIEEFSDGPSGWSLDSIIILFINIGKLNPMRAGCHIALAKEISNKGGCVNLKTDDDMYVIWAILARLYPK